jgi:hypothetical protein
MRLVTSPAAAEHVRAAGGAVYVWPTRASCCGGTVELRASTQAPDKTFRRAEVDGLELYLTAGMGEPDVLELDLSRRGKLRAYWNGLAWVV